MERAAIKEILEKLQSAIEKARRAAEAAKEAENEMSKSAATSWSAAGEREYTRQQAKIASENFEKLESLGREVSEAVTEPVPETIRPVCLVTVEYLAPEGQRIGESDLPRRQAGNRKEETFYFVSKSVYLNGVKLISPESPIGMAVAEKSVGEGFEYEVGTERVRGKITWIG